MARIQYVGAKPHGREDTIAGTGLRWDQPGDIKEVADAAAVAKLLKHPDIWRVAPEEAAANPAVLPNSTPPVQPPAAKTPAKTPAKGKGKDKHSEPPKFVLVDEAGKDIALDAMDDEQLAAFAGEHGVEFDAALTGDARRAAIYEAATKE